MKEKSLAKKLGNIATKQKAFVAILIILIAMAFFKTNFYTTYNVLDMVNSASINMIVAFGITMVIIASGIDLSVGGCLVVAGITVIKFINIGAPTWLAILGALLVGAVIGAINGYFVVYRKKEPFIITLAMGIILTGFAMQITDAHPVSPSNIEFMMIGNGKLIFGIPNLVLIMLAVFILTYCILRYTQFGRNCYAIGGDYEVAEYSGINVKLIKASTYVLCSTLTALAGVLLSSRLNSGSSTYGSLTALTVISSVVVGGTSLAGGVGGIPQTAIGLLLIAIIQNAMNMLGVEPYIQYLVTGIVIVAVIALDSYGRKLKREAV